MAVTTVMTVTATETPSAGRKSSNAVWKLRSVNWSGHRCGVAELAAEPGSRAVLTIQ